MKYLLLVFGIFLFYQSLGQLNWDRNKYEVSTSLFVSSDSTLPFWMRSQTFGEVPISSQFLQLKASMHHEYDSTYNREQQLKPIDVGYGATLVGNLGLVNQAILSEAYVKTRWKVFELWAGRRKEIIGLVDSTLSTGSLIWGQNALPIPKIQVGIPNYTSIIGQGLISIKGTFAHGWFGSTDSVKNYLLHQKTFYARVGRPHWRFKFFGGVNHQVQWGGRPAVPFYERDTDQTITKFPTGLGTYLNVISGLSLNSGGDQLNNPNGIPSNEALNRVGNHLGTIDVGFEFNISKKASIFGYRQSIYEDGSLFYLSNISDGLHGLSLKIKNELKIGLSHINFEYLKSSNQGGATGSNFTIPELRGVDHYFNNGLYEDGWTYDGRSLANSLFLPIQQYRTVSNQPDIHDNKIVNSRIEAFHFSLVGHINKLNYLLKLTTSLNKGAYLIPFDNLRQSHFLLGTSYRLNSYNFEGNLGVDYGDFLGTRIGLNLSMKKSFVY